MKRSWKMLLLCLITPAVFSADDLGKSTYQMACKNCHEPQLAKAMKAPAAFNKKEWKSRFQEANRMAKQHPERYKTPIDYLLNKVKMGKGLMVHGGLCNESPLPNKNCSDEALIQAIHYMSQY